MVQVRKLVLAIATATALSSGMAHALGLGELTLRSSANQPLVADIELLDVRDLGANDVKPALAPAAEFAKAGVPRPAYLDDLTFTPIISPNGRSLIRITSSQPVSEPLVKFLVQVNWPSGRQTRDYSLLLDPSKFSAETAKAATQAAPTPAVSAPTTPARGGQYTTTPRDTLWDIADRVAKPATVQQAMLAIQALNPDAFIGGNINLIKTGQVLRLPDPQQSAALPQAQAVAEVARQNAAWREGRRLGPRAQQVDATRRGPGSPAPAVAPASDKLSLVSASAEGGDAKGASGDAQALNAKLAVAEESLDSTRRANAELQSRNADLQSQLDKLQKILQLKNDQLARLEAASSGTSSVPAVTASSVPSAAAPAPVEPVSPPIAAQLTPPVDSATATPATPEAAPLDTPLEAEQPPLDTRSDTDKLLANPLLFGLLAGGGVLVVLLLLLLLARRRRARLEAEKHMRMARALAEESDRSHADFDMPESSFDGLERPSASVQLTPAMVAASVAAATAAAAHTPTTFAPPPPQTVIPLPALQPSAELPADVLPEVEQSITLGRLNRAAELLEGAIAREPERSDLRLKLMEVYGRQGDRDAFVGQERQLVANGQNFAEAEALKNRFPAMLGVAAVATGAAAAAAQMHADYVKDLLDEPPAKEAPKEEPADDFDSDFDLSLDDFDADETHPGDTSATAPALAEPATPAADKDLDFESMLAEQQRSTDVDSPQDLDEFDLDLGDAPATPTAQAADEHDLPDDFDLSLADDPVPPEPVVAERAQVSAELDRLSDSLAKPPVASPFATPPSPEELARQDAEEEFDFLSGTDEAATKLDLARAYIEMSDDDGARDILEEVLREGNSAQQAEAQEMIARLA
jgi:pilus assembly protein FimV